MVNALILGAAIGNCVHVAGLVHFLQYAEQEGYETLFLGPAVPLESLFERIRERKPRMVALSYRLTPENGAALLAEVHERSRGLDFSPIWAFGGTPEVARLARKTGMFSFISDGYDDIDDSIRFLRHGAIAGQEKAWETDIISRIKAAYPYPVLRHHFGLPSLEETVRGIEHIASASVLDVISIGPDQNAQQFFFRPENMNPAFDGAGGVPVRSPEDFIRLKKASQTGNLPLMRCYSGTADVAQYAKILLETIDNAWLAVPLFWYNELDGRGTRPLEVSIQEAQNLIAWHAARGIPVEINEPHHWGLRDAHDVMQVATAYIAAYNAKKLGVKNYIAQYMFNNPKGLSFPMDLARVLAMIDMVESLHDKTFTSFRQTRAGLPLFAPDLSVAQGQLAASTFMQMAVQPHIIHVVGYCEASHAATAREVIESCKIVRGVIRHTLGEDFGIQTAPHVLARKEELIHETKVLLDFIYETFYQSEDPLCDAAVMAECVKRGYLDAVHILKGDKFKGTLSVCFQDGKCLACKEGRLLGERERLTGLDQKRPPIDNFLKDIRYER